MATRTTTSEKFAPDCAGDADGELALPCFMGPDGAELVEDDNYWILDEDKQPFVDNFRRGDTVAGMIVSPFVGSRGDVTTSARYEDGQWTLELRRALTTSAGTAEDTQFSDLDAVYEFGVAVFDYTQTNHAAHSGMLKLRFARPD